MAKRTKILGVAGQHRTDARRRPALRHARRRRGRGLVVALSSVLAFVVLVAGAGAGALYYFDHSRTVLANPLSTRTAPSYGDQNILLLGSDTRGQIDTANGLNDGSRSDTMVLVHIPADRKSVQAITLLRDMYVPIKDNGSGKLNWAMFFGGVPLAVDTVENLLGIKIDHVAVIDFLGVERVSTALGGVIVDNPTEFSEGIFTFKVGKVRLMGGKALAFVRGRHQFADGDKRRVINQQLFLQACLDKVLHGGSLTNPGEMVNVYQAIINSVSVDDGLNAGYILKLAQSYSGLTAKDVRFFTLSVKGQFSRGPHTFWNVDQDQLARVKMFLAADKLSEYLPPESTPTPTPTPSRSK